MEKPAKLKVRKLNINDLDDIMEIELNSFPYPWSSDSYRKELEENLFARYYGVVFEERLIAFMGYWAIVDESHVSNIAVHPLFRRQGVGEYLLRHVMVYSLREGCLRMTLEVRKSNLNAQHLYEKLGFRSYGIRPRYYSNNDEDAVIMWADLPECLRIIK